MPPSPSGWPPTGTGTATGCGLRSYSDSAITSSDFISVQANGTCWHHTVGTYNDFADVDIQFATCPDGFQDELVSGPCVTVI